MKRSMLMCLSVAVFGVSCERHEFDGPDGTRQLHEKHAAAAHDAAPADAAHAAIKEDAKPAEKTESAH